MSNKYHNKPGISLVIESPADRPSQAAQDTGHYYAEQRASERLHSALSRQLDPASESGEDHRDRLFLQVLLSLGANILALIGIFYFLIPLSDRGREFGSFMLWGILAVTAGITFLFLRFGWRELCVNLLLLGLSALLLGASFMLGGVMSPTIIFLLAMPVLAATLTRPRWAFIWTALTVVAWLTVLVLQFSGVEMSRITRASNVGLVQMISLLGTLLVIMAVLGSYVAANSRLRTGMEKKSARLDYLARHDPLTGIPNRRAFFQHSHECLHRARRSGLRFALVIIDLNDFKLINDRFGHKVGDAVLEQFAGLLSRHLRDTDFVGRLGGDEFGVILEPVDDVDGVRTVLDRLLRATPLEVETDGHTVRYDGAIGTALYPADGETVLALYEAADSAMYAHKRETPAEFIWR